MDTHMHPYTDTESALIASKSTESEPEEKQETTLPPIQWGVGIETIRSRTKRGLHDLG